MSLQSKIETIAAVDSAMDNTWAANSLAALRHIALSKKYVTVDDLWKVITKPEGDQAKVGAVMNRATSKNTGVNPFGPFLVKTPYRVYSERGNHDNVVLWESSIFQAGNEIMPEVATLHADPSLDLVAMLKVYKAARAYSDKGMTVEAAATLNNTLDSIFATEGL